MAIVIILRVRADKADPAKAGKIKQEALDVVKADAHKLIGIIVRGLELSFKGYQTRAQFTEKTNQLESITLTFMGVSTVQDADNLSKQTFAHLISECLSRAGSRYGVHSIGTSTKVNDFLFDRQSFFQSMNKLEQQLSETSSSREDPEEYCSKITENLMDLVVYDARHPQYKYDATTLKDYLYRTFEGRLPHSRLHYYHGYFLKIDFDLQLKILSYVQKNTAKDCPVACLQPKSLPKLKAIDGHPPLYLTINSKLGQALESIDNLKTPKPYRCQMTKVIMDLAVYDSRNPGVHYDAENLARYLSVHRGQMPNNLPYEQGKHLRINYDLQKKILRFVKANYAELRLKNIRQLLNKCKLPFRDDTKTLNQALRRAAGHLPVDDLMALIKSGADINSQDENKEKQMTPLHHALEKKHLWHASALIQMGAKINLLNAQWVTAFHLINDLPNSDQKQKILSECEGLAKPKPRQAKPDHGGMKTDAPEGGGDKEKQPQAKTPPPPARLSILRQGVNAGGETSTREAATRNKSFCESCTIL